MRKLTDIEARQKHDQMKNRFCEKNGIFLLRISFEEEKNIEEILKQNITKQN